MLGGATGGQKIQMLVNNAGTGASASVAFEPVAGAWVPVEVPLAALGAPFEVTSIQWFNATDGAQAVFYLDDVVFVASGAPPPQAVAGPGLRVDAGAGQHAISPFIYGINFAGEDLANALRLPLRRWGGNATTRYNWQNDTSNRAFDWYFENIPNDNPAPGLPRPDRQVGRALGRFGPRLVTQFTECPLSDADL